ncbi:MAG: hypothetical protein P4L59_06995 [Desulfosporosinus sp.]|nr:hypothetical protein [Desulfosporosinus sp.]
MVKIHFSAVKRRLKELLKSEKILLSNKFYENFLKFVSKICTYEEESRKIRPTLVLGFNIGIALEQVPNHYILMTKEGKKDGSDLEKIMKALIPFCNNGWFVYMDVKSNCIEYGLLRAFSGPKGLAVTEILFDTDGIAEELINYGLIEIKVLSNFEMSISGLQKNKLIIDFRFANHDDSAHSDNCISVVKDITSGISETDRETVNSVFYKLFQMTAQRVHGTICLIVKSDYEFPNKFLSDGVWLKEPVNLTQKALYAVRDKKDSISSEMFYGLTGLLIEMMNVDGITVIDNEGKVRGYNIFINESILEEESSGTRRRATLSEIEVCGGARKRAAYALLRTRDPNIMGVYFQSQDGNTFYERMRVNE